jgi:hypothetical protein
MKVPLRWLPLPLLLVAACQVEDHADPGKTQGGGSQGSEVRLTRFGTTPRAFINYSAIREARQAVVRDSSGWRQLWEEIHANTSPAPELPPIDFSQQMVVMAALGGQATGGYDILLERATLDDTALTIDVTSTHPGPGCVLTQAETSPVDLATVPRHEGAIRFVETPRETSCGN